MKRTLAAAIVLSLASAAFADKPATPTFDPKRMSDEDKMLSSDEFEGRGPDTAAEVKTIAYVTEQMKAAGLQPGW